MQLIENIQQQNMKDLSPSELTASVKYQFSRRCGHSEQLLARMSQDFITRYSPKQQPHPDFFKQDAALTHNQFTLYSDQCIQAMRKFYFMETPAEVLAALISSILKINEFLAKQLYHCLKNQKQETSLHISEPLCSSCSKLRENERVRVLKDQLHVSQMDNLAPKNTHEMVTRKGEKYDVEELLQEQLQNFDSLNEEQIRKRLAKLQTDHDKRRQQMVVCIDQLVRANERVAGYGKIAQKKNDTGRFNVKDYIFQLSRHFYHNISSLDHKIKQLKQVLNPIQDSQTQTLQTCIVLSYHLEIVNQNTIQINRLKYQLNDAQSLLLIQQRKCKEQTSLNEILLQRLKKLQIEQEQQRIAGIITQSHLKGTLTQVQSKADSLQTIIKKLKTSNKLKDLDYTELEDSTSKPPTSSSKHRGNSKLQIFEDGPLERKQGRQKSYIRMNLGLKKHQRIQNCLNPQICQKINKLRQQNEGKQQKVNQIAHQVEKIFVEINQQNRDKLAICNSFNENITFVSIKQLQFTHKKRRTSIYEQQLNNILQLNAQKQSSQKVRYLDKNEEFQSHQRAQKKKITRVQFKKGLQRLATIRGKQNTIGLQISNLPYQEGKNEQQNLEGGRKSLLQRRKSKMQYKKTFHQNKYTTPAAIEQKYNVNLIQKFKLQKKDTIFYDPFIKKTKGKKRRNFSQQNSLDQKQDYQSIRRSIDKIMSKQPNVFAQQENKALIFQKTSQDFETKLSKKNTFYRIDPPKNVLSLQEINYSTYFYSLIAKLHLKNPVAYVNLKKLLNSIPGQNLDEDGGVKNSITTLIINHRKCKGGGSICNHLQTFLEKVRNS